jgi:hypothetical protein
MASHGPSEEFHDPRRKPLVEKFVEVIGTRYATTTTWAFLWLGDIEKLERLVNKSRAKVRGVLSAERDLGVAQLCRLLNLTISC